MELVKQKKIIRSSEMITPTANTGATSLPPTDDSFLYIETSAKKDGKIVFFVVLNDRVLFKQVVLVSIIPDFQQEVIDQ